MDQGNLNQSSNTRTPFGQRVLACIVFSDTVSFSEKMNLDEELTLSMVNADLEQMEEICNRNEGRVLKSTGDGLLMYFSSAVQAVTTAMEIQNNFGEREKKSEEGTVLIHRLGIHLGDVFLTERDVMGDGVNIAARLEAQAEPGGICISQTVYDVVKNKLDLQTIYHGPRELKNIGPVPVYEVLLTRDLASGKQGQKRRRARRKKGQGIPWMGIIGGVVAAGLVIGTFAATIKYINSQKEPVDPTDPVVTRIAEDQKTKPAKPSGSQTQPATPGPGDKDPADKPPSSTNPDDPDATDATKKTVVVNNETSLPEPKAEDEKPEEVQPPPDRTELAISQFVANNKVIEREEDPAGPTETDPSLSMHDFSILKDWFKESVSRYTRNNPLDVTWIRNNKSVDVKIWCPPYRVQSTVFMYRSRSGASSFRFDTIKSPVNKTRLVYALLEGELKRGNPPSQEVLEDIMVLFKATRQKAMEDKFINLLKSDSIQNQADPNN